LIPFNIVGALEQKLAADQRQPDGLLHCSGDLIGPLRHSQLTAAGAPTVRSPLVQEVRLRTGTMWHSFFNELLIEQGHLVMHEVKMRQWLPEGWAGTLDWLMWDTNKRAFVLGDLKTTKGEGMFYIERNGAKEEHLWQLSAYYHALVNAKFPMLEGFSILYLPMNNDGGRNEATAPVQADCVPLDADLVWGRMEERWAATRPYLRAVRRDGEYLNEFLAPPADREQKMVWDSKRERWDLKLVPHWSTRFCSYDTELCDCSEQGVTKIGEYAFENGTLVFTPRAGQEALLPPDLLRPTEAEVTKRNA